MKMNFEKFAYTYNTSKNKKILIDIRTPEELEETGSLSEAINIPTQEFAARLDELDPNEEIYIFCRSGARASRVYDFLEESGFKKIFASTEGGFTQLAQLMN